MSASFFDCRLFSIYVVGYFGKKKGYNQMVTIHNFFEKTLGEEF